MSNSKIYSKKFLVVEKHLDGNNHVNNIVYMEWLQEVAIGHSSNIGWTSKKYKENNRVWFAKSHFIEYKNQAYMDDTIIINTWIDSTTKCSAIRKYEFYNQNNAVIAKAETVWVFMNTINSKPAIILDDIKSQFID